MGRRPAVVVLALAALAAPAEAAEVSTVTTCISDEFGCQPVTVARYVAGPGEANDLSIAWPDRVMVFRDRVPLVAHSGCAAREDGSVACPALQAVVELGDRSFAVTHFTGPGRNVRVRLRIPPRIRRFARSPLPVIVRLRARDLDGGFGHRLRWVIELPR